MSSFTDAIERGRRGFPGPMKKRPPLSQAYWNRMLAGCGPPGVGDDEDAVRFRHNERQADRDAREDYRHWRYFHGE